MKLVHIFTILAFVFLLSSCEERLVMVPEFEPPISDRKVLLEELTGVRCPNCPKGAEFVKNLKAQYGDQLIPVGIHGSFLTIPLSESKYDFRNEFALELEDFLETGPKPAAALNRIKHTEELALSTPELWSNSIEIELAKEHVMEVYVENTYDPTTRIIDIVVTLVALKDFTTADDLRLSLMIVQNEIEDAQEDPDEVIEEYVHEHVLRTMLTAARGDLIQQDLSENLPVNFNFSFTIPADADLGEKEAPWVPEHVEVVAFVNKIIGSDVKDVLQAESAKVIE